MKIISLTGEQLDIAKKHIGTEYTCITDGCMCGEWEVKLADDIYLTLYRSCRKANATPMGEQWNIDSSVYVYSIQLCDKWKDEDKYYKSLIGKLDRFQTKILRDIANKTTELECGHNVYGESL